MHFQFFFRRKRDERREKEQRNKDMYHGVHEPSPRGSVRQAAQPRGVGEFARRAPDHNQYDAGQHRRGFRTQSQRYSGPRFARHGDCCPPMRHERVDLANPTAEQMACYRFSSHFANPSVDAIAHSSCF
jgi:hypothetical protein